jgi:hypothetical protein
MERLDRIVKGDRRRAPWPNDRIVRMLVAADAKEHDIPGPRGRTRRNVRLAWRRLPAAAFALGREAVVQRILTADVASNM